jgi:cell division transport system permease protein
VDRAAGAWSADVMNEISVTVLPRDGDPLEPRLGEVAEILRSTEGLGAVRVVPADQSEALLEPWLGSDVNLTLLPVPRLVTAERTGPVDGDALELRLAGISGASLDDHAGWSQRLSDMASAIAGAAVAALLLMLVATALAIVFATRATIAANAATVDVLTVLGAEEGFIVRVFRRRFLAIGLKGAAAGLGAALVLFGALELWAALSPAASSPQARALFGDPSIGPAGYLTLSGVAAAVAGLVALTSTLAVRRHLDQVSP